jgi:phosphoglycerate dehydrogenase-like enzyme
MDLTEENMVYFYCVSLGQARKGRIFINIARGEHVITEDLLKLLKEGRLGALGLDVYENEYYIAVSLRNQSAGISREAARCKARFTSYQITYFLEHNDLTKITQ